MYQKTITPQEARDLGVYDRHEFQEVEETYRGSGFYVIEFQTGIKIGISKNICSRMKEYKKPWVQPIRNIRCYKHPNPFSLELFVKRRFAYANKLIENSTEYLIGHSFQYVVNYLEQNKFYRKAKRV